MSIVTPLELAAYLFGTTDENDLADEWIAQASAVLDMATTEVETAAGVQLTRPEVLTLAGVWGRDLQLPTGLVAVTEVTLNDEPLDSASWWWNGRDTLRRGGSFTADEPDPYPEDRELGGALRVPGMSWGGPAATVLVSVQWPDDVPEIAKALVKRIAARTIGNPSGATQEALGPYSVTHAAGASAGTLTDRERKQIRRAIGARRSGTATTGP